MGIPRISLLGRSRAHTSSLASDCLCRDRGAVGSEQGAQFPGDPPETRFRWSEAQGPARRDRTDDLPPIGSTGLSHAPARDGPAGEAGHAWTAVQGDSAGRSVKPVACRLSSWPRERSPTGGEPPEGVIRHLIDDGLEVDAHPVAGTRVRVMVAGAEAGKIRLCGVETGNLNRRDAVVRVVEGHEPQMLPCVPEPFQFPMPCRRDEWVKVHGRRGKCTAVRKPDAALHERESPADGLVQVDVRAPHVGGPGPLQRTTEICLRALDFLLQALIAAVLRWMTGRLRARGACQAGSECHGKSSHLPFVRGSHHRWQVAVSHGVRQENLRRADCWWSARGQWWECGIWTAITDRLERRLPATGNRCR